VEYEKWKSKTFYKIGNAAPKTTEKALFAGICIFLAEYEYEV
jgi:hypothetical protein